MPEDQESAVARRRSRRQVQETTVAEEPALRGATEPSTHATSEANIGASSSSTHPRRKPRATAQTSAVETPSTRASSSIPSRASEGAVMNNMADMETSPAPNSVPVPSDAPGRRRASRGPGAAAARGRKSSTENVIVPGAEVENSTAAETPAMRADAVHGDILVDSTDPRRGARVGRPRGSRAAATSPESPRRDEEVNAGMDEAKKSVPRVSRSRRGSRSEDGTGSISTPTLADIPGGRELDGALGGSPSPTFATEPYRPAARSSYRFGRSRQENDVTPEAESPSQPQPAALQPHLRPSELSNMGIARYAVPDGSLRTDRTPTQLYVSRGRVVSVCSHMFPVERIHIARRQQGQRSGGVGQSRTSGNPGGHSGQHGQFPPSPSGQPSRGSAPYSPGGRGGHAPSQPVSGHDMPYAPPSSGAPGGTGGQNSSMPGAPYGGYEPV